VRVYRIPFSTNVERVALALGHKGLEVEWIDVADHDRGPVEAASGQRLVPVLDDDGTIVADSPVIVRYLEAKHPKRPVYPAEASRRAEVELFVDWFNTVWKRPPNLIAAELEKPEPDERRIDELGSRITGELDRFEALLAGRDWLFGDAFGVADLMAFPFLKYVTIWEDGDPHVFHQILRDWQPRGGHPRVEAWIARVDALPRA
jgi:glutathione S-transferase